MLRKYFGVVLVMMSLFGCKTVQQDQAQVASVSDARVVAKKTGRYARNGLQDALSGVEKAVSNVSFAIFAIRSGIITGLTAKNTCSLRFVEQFDLATAKKLGSQYGSNLIVSASETTNKLNFDGENLTLPGILAEGKISQFIPGSTEISPHAVALFHKNNPRLGCALIGKK